MSKNIVGILKQEHQELLGLVTEIIDLSKDKLNKIKEIDHGLKKLKKDLQKHIELENETFYPDLLKKMKEQNEDTSNTEKFISEMKGIEKVVMKFLSDYDSVSGIESDKLDFKTRMNDIAEALTLRIEAEESGVFSLWLAYSK